VVRPCPCTAEHLFKAVRQSPDQILKSYSFPLDTADSASAALQAACEVHGNKAPDAVFAVAGAARPGFFIEQTEQMLIESMNSAYWVQAWTALVGKKGHMCVLGLNVSLGSCKEDGTRPSAGQDCIRVFDTCAHVFCGIYPLCSW
jgi:hypothetical protein